NDADIAFKTVVKPQQINKEVEYFTIVVTPENNNQGTIDISWERTMISLPFNVPTHQIAMESIKNNLNANAKASDYYAAGGYLYTSGEDPKKALEYVNRAIEMNLEKHRFICCAKKH